MARLVSLNMRLLLPLLFVAGVLALACSQSGIATPPPPTQPIIAEPTSPPSPASSPVSIPVPPTADLYELARQLKVKASIQKPPLDELSEATVGDKQAFWVIDLDKKEPFQVTATLRLTSPHLYMWVADDARVSERDLAASAREFEEVIYPLVAKKLGKVFSEEDPVLTVLHANIPTVAGYYNSRDEFPREVYPLSNQRRMVYINVGALAPGTVAYLSTLAHELHHFVQFHSDPSEQAWINEGLSTLVEERAGYPTFAQDHFRGKPDTQLTAWAEDPRESLPHYGASYLFLRYLLQHFGNEGLDTALANFVSQPEKDIDGVERYLRSQGHKVTFDQVFKDWVVANYLDDPAEGRYSYESLGFRVPPTDRLTRYQSIRRDVYQYAADYVEIALNEGDATIIFQGAPQVKLVPNNANSGQWQWWSNRGDSISSTLTREVDLRGLDTATLEYSLWFDIEEHFDYGYVTVSTDGGNTWDALQGRYSTMENPLGQAFGPAYTGASGGGTDPIWVREHLDLSPYAGQLILLRFQYVTDAAINLSGLAIDDIAIPGLGLQDNVEEGEREWIAEGFVRTSNILAQRFMVQVIEFGDEIRVKDLPLSPQQRGELDVSGFGDEVDKVVLVIAGATRFTNEKARYDISVEPLLRP